MDYEKFIDGLNLEEDSPIHFVISLFYTEISYEDYGYSKERVFEKFYLQRIQTLIEEDKIMKNMRTKALNCQKENREISNLNNIMIVSEINRKSQSMFVRGIIYKKLITEEFLERLDKEKLDYTIYEFTNENNIKAINGTNNSLNIDNFINPDWFDKNLINDIYCIQINNNHDPSDRTLYTKVYNLLLL